MKCKVLFVIESLSGGGAEKILSVVLKYLDKNRFDVTLCCIVDTGVYNAEVKSFVNYFSIIPDPNMLRSVWRKIYYLLLYKLVYNYLPLSWVYRFFVPKENDIEIAFVEGFATKLLSASSNKNAKKIAWVHTDLINNHWIDFLYKNIREEYKSYSQYKYVVGVSNTVSKSINSLYGLQSSIKTIYNPIESDNIKMRSKLKGCLCPRIRKHRLVSMGRFVSQKGYHRLLRIMNRLVQEQYDVELWLLGDGDERKELEFYIRENYLEQVVTLWGFQDNPYAYLSQSDLFVCSSMSEGYSTAVAESLILGVPVVTTDCSGMDELLDGGRYGVITDNNEDGLYWGLKSILDSTEVYLYYKKMAEFRSNNFDLSKLMRPIEQLLEL